MKTIFLIAFLVSNLSAKPVDLLLKAAKNSSLNAEEKKGLVSLVFGKQAVLEESLQKLSEKDPALGQILQQAFESRFEENLEKNRLGAMANWFILNVGNKQNEKPTACPIFSKIDPKSPAYRAKFRVGDVVTHIEKVDISGSDTRNRLMFLLKIWPNNTPLAVKIRRNKNVAKLSDILPRKTIVQASVKLATK